MKIPKHCHNPAAVLFFVLVGCCMLGVASGKTNLLSKLGDASTVDDAATGTVLNEKSPKDMSCDGQLAFALAEAKEFASTAQAKLDEEVLKHKTALETVVVLQTDLAQTNKKLLEERDALNKLQKTMNKSLETEKKRSKEELEVLKDRAQKELEALGGGKDAAIELLKKESSLALESANQLAAKKYEDLKREKEGMISSLEAKLKMSNKELEATMRMELSKAKEDKDRLVSKITAERDTTVAELTERMEKAAKDAAEAIKNIREEAESKLAAAEADRNTRLENMTQSMENAAKEHAKLLQVTKEEAKENLSKQQDSIVQQAEKMRIEYEETMLEKNENIKNLQNYKEETTERMAAIENLLEEANQEVSQWRLLHSQRTYCNMTHVAADMYDAGAVAYEQASDAAVLFYAESLNVMKNCLHYSKDVIRNQVDEGWSAISPYYEEHISDNYRTHLEPHLQEYVFPQLRHASSWSNEVVKPRVLEAIKGGKEVYNSQIAPLIEDQRQEASRMFDLQYERLARLYGDYCSSSLQEFLKASQELELLKDHPPPTFLLHSWETSCKNPRDSLSVLLQGASILFLVIFYRRLFRLSLSIVAFSLSLVIRLSPLRFVIPRGKETKVIESQPRSPSLSPPSLKEASTDSLNKSHEE